MARLLAKTALDKEPQDCIFTVDGTKYMFEVWHGQNDVLVALYTAETGNLRHLDSRNDSLRRRRKRPETSSVTWIGACCLWAIAVEDMKRYAGKGLSGRNNTS